MLALYIEPGWLAGIDSYLTISGLQGFFPKTCVRIPSHVRSVAARLISEMFESTMDRRSQARWVEMLIEMMLAVTYDFSAWRTSAAICRASQHRQSDPRINRAMSFMNENLLGGITFEQIAKLCHLSPAQFFHLFKECTAVSPALYLNALRMESAFARLVHDCGKISTLSDGFGFSEPHHFTRFFRQNFGTPPSEYRRRVERFP